jgi:hypothetical protein
MTGGTRISKEEAFKLLDEGLGPKDLVARGVSVSTSYYWTSQWKVSKGKQTEMNSAEKVSFLFELFKKGTNMVDAIAEGGRRGITYEEVVEARRKYNRAARMVIMDLKEVKKLTSELVKAWQDLADLRSS